MSECTPSDAEVRADYIAINCEDEDSGDAFDRWLSRHDRQVIAEYAQKSSHECEARRDDTCPTICDPDCEAICHESHEVRWKREHQPEQCPSTKGVQR